MTDEQPLEQQPLEHPDEQVTPRRYAAYDTTYLRYVGGVHATKKAAREAAKDRGAETVEIREV